MNSFIWPLYWLLTNTITLGRRGPESNEGVPHIVQNSQTFLGRSLPLSGAYSPAPANWTFFSFVFFVRNNTKKLRTLLLPSFLFSPFFFRTSSRRKKKFLYFSSNLKKVWERQWWFLSCSFVKWKFVSKYPIQEKNELRKKMLFPRLTRVSCLLTQFMVTKSAFWTIKEMCKYNTKH